jgi:hypothetical protein
MRLWAVKTIGTTRYNILPHLPHDLCDLAVVPLGVDRVRDLGRRVPEGQLGGL